MEQKAAQPNRLPGLDGLRAISITMVIVFHLATLPGFPHHPISDAVIAHGSFGVNIFFVISGYLITWLLLKEEQKRRIDLKKFYLRRSFRILPASLVFLGTVSVMALAGWSAAKPPDIFASLFFARNFYHGGSPDTSHFWTLSIEEQFYLFWPVLVLATKGYKRIAAVCVLLIVFPVLRQVSYQFAHGERGVDVRHDVILVGCLLALLRRPNRNGWLLSGPAVSAFVPIVAVTVISLFLMYFDQIKGVRLLTIPVTSFCVAAIVNYVLASTPGFITRILNSWIFVGVGKLSYGLYLWQQLFCWGSASFAMPPLPAVACTLALALASYFLIEQPILRMRKGMDERIRDPKRTEPATFSAVGATGGDLTR